MNDKDIEETLKELSLQVRVLNAQMGVVKELFKSIIDDIGSLGAHRIIMDEFIEGFDTLFNKKENKK